MKRNILVSAVLSLCAFTSGCVFPISEVDVYLPDRDRHNTVTVVGIQGRTVELSDGRKVELAGLGDPCLEDRAERVRTRQILRELSGVPVLAVPESQGRVRLMKIDTREHSVMKGLLCPFFAGHPQYQRRDAPAMMLIPIPFYHAAPREDLNLRLLSWGLAPPRLEEIDDRGRREQYRNVAALAQQDFRGMWGNFFRDGPD